MSEARSPRVIDLWGAVWLGLGSILGTGVFVSLSLAAYIAGVGVLPALLFAALLATANGLSSAQLAAAMPVNGGTYEYAHRLGQPQMGFAAGWLFLVAKSASAATAALGCSGYLIHLSDLDAPPWLTVALALVLVGVLTTLVAAGLRRSNLGNLVLVTVTLMALACFVIFGVLSADPVRARMALSPEALMAVFDHPRSLLEATALVFVAFTGYGRIATLGGEVRDPAGTIPRAIVITLAMAALIHLAVAATALATVGHFAFGAAVGGQAAPLEVVARTFSVKETAELVAVGAITAMAGVLLNLLLGLSRVLQSMAARGELPRALARTDGPSANPRRAVWVMGAVVAALVCLGDIHTVLSLSAFAVLVYYGITHLAALKLPPAQRRYGAWVAGVGLVGCVLLAFSVRPAAWLTGLAILAAGFGVRGLCRAVAER